MKIVLIYPHQLFEHNTLLNHIDAKRDKVFLIEDSLYFDQYNFHKLKIELHKRTMSFYASYLKDKGYKVHTCKKLEDCIKSSEKIEMILTYDVVDNYLEKKIQKFCGAHSIHLQVFDTPMFLTTNAQIDEYLALPKNQNNQKRAFFMKNFYEWQRKRLNTLIDNDGGPVGGKWSFDEDNRKKVPKDLDLPDDLVSPLYKGDNFPYATDFKEAKKCLQHFLKTKLVNFGPYEDAILEKENVLFHSVLTPYLNIGLLTPEEVIKETLKYAEKNDVPLNSLEGFIRQIIGWREYMRMVYIKLGSKIRNGNYFKAKKKIPYTFWTGKTGILPVDNTIQKLISTAYTHHIPRLMIMGNFMNLCGFDPDEVYRWFMEMYIDSYDWVMVPNVYSMALYADGGMITTKPYISGSSYILKMSDFKRSSEEKSWNKIWDALFWSFVGKHFDKLKSEGRLGFIGIQYMKMSAKDRHKHDALAKEFLEGLGK